MALRVIDWRSERNEHGQIAAASFICPSCGNRTWTGVHEIHEGGRVHPAVECDHECGLIDHIILAGWPWGTIGRAP